MDVHIGKEIERKYQQSGLKISEFASRLNTGKRNVYSIFERPEISTAQLRKISEVLGFDFFQLYALSPKTEQPLNGVSAKTKITVLVELDGTRNTVDKWINRLSAINAAIE